MTRNKRFKIKIITIFYGFISSSIGSRFWMQGFCQIVLRTILILVLSGKADIILFSSIRKLVVPTIVTFLMTIIAFIITICFPLLVITITSIKCHGCGHCYIFQLAG